MESQEHVVDPGMKELELDDETVSGCFDFRLRTRSFDLHQVAQIRKLKKLGFHLRSGSDSDVTDAKMSPSKTSKSNSPVPSTSRRFVRVVRNSQNPDLENPHIIHRFSQDFMEHCNIERANSISEGVKPLPYSVTGHTILKKQATIDKPEMDLPESPSLNKHAKFFDEVVVIEFDKKCTIRKDLHVTHKEKLHDECSEAQETTSCLIAEKVNKSENHGGNLNHQEKDIIAEELNQSLTDQEVFLADESNST